MSLLKDGLQEDVCLKEARQSDQEEKTPTRDPPFAKLTPLSTISEGVGSLPTSSPGIIPNSSASEGVEAPKITDHLNVDR